MTALAYLEPVASYAPPTREEIIASGLGTYHFPRWIKPREVDGVVQSGYWICVAQMNFTWALMIGVHRFGYERRFCFEHLAPVLEALVAWTGDGDPVGPWIKEKPSDRLNPDFVKEASS